MLASCPSLRRLQYTIGHCIKFPSHAAFAGSPLLTSNERHLICSYLPVHHSGQLQSLQVLKEWGTLFGVRVKNDDIVLGSGDGCIQVFQLLTQDHMTHRIKAQRS